MRNYFIPGLLLCLLALIAAVYLIRRPKSQPSFIEINPSLAVSRYEVTVHQFAVFLNATDYAYVESDQLRVGNGAYMVSKGQKFMPVHTVSMLDAQAYAAWLSADSGFHIRLLTESEWLLAAQGGLTNPVYAYGWGPDRTIKEIIDVRKSISNNTGLYGMTGNVAEWVSSPNQHSIAMGGSWAEDTAEKLKLSVPQKFPAAYADKDVGFRVCMAVD